MIRAPQNFEVWPQEWNVGLSFPLLIMQTIALCEYKEISISFSMLAEVDVYSSVQFVFKHFDESKQGSKSLKLLNAGKASSKVSGKSHND